MDSNSEFSLRWWLDNYKELREYVRKITQAPTSVQIHLELELVRPAKDTRRMFL